MRLRPPRREENSEEARYGYSYGAQAERVGESDGKTAIAKSLMQPFKPMAWIHPAGLRRSF